MCRQESGCSGADRLLVGEARAQGKAEGPEERQGRRRLWVGPSGMTGVCTRTGVLKAEPAPGSLTWRVC